MRSQGVRSPFSTLFPTLTVLVVALLCGSASLHAQDAAALDIYGGSTALTCPNGPAPHFYTQKIGDRWWLCTPAGNVFWLRGVYHVDSSDDGLDHQGNRLSTVLTAKYGNNSTKWGPPTVARLRSWGFNGTAEFSISYVLPTTTNPDWTSTPDQSNPEKMPFIGLLWPARYARNRNSYAPPIKELVRATNPSVFPVARRRNCLDVFDPNLAQWLHGDLQDYQNGEYYWTRSSHSDYLIGINVDETDEMFGFGAGPDFKGFINGQPDDFSHVHMGWIVLVTPPTQTSGVDANGNPIDYTSDPRGSTTVYSKQALSDWLAARYNGDITLLNLAWGSAYTTFGSNGGWGSGDGLLDEDGATHSWVPRDFTRLSDATPNVQRDLDDFLLFFAQQYFSTIRGVLQTEAPGVMYLGPSNIGSWGAPARRQILQAASQYVDVIHISPIPTQCVSCTDDQARIDFVAQWGGDKPWVNWETITAQNDSYMSPFPIPATSVPDAGTQAMRGQRYQTMIQQLMDAKDSSGIHHTVGFKWWQYYDGRGQQANWGLVTLRDNAYDGTSAIIAPGVDAWGYSTGGEQANYGDFISSVTAANQNIYTYLLGLP